MILRFTSSTDFTTPRKASTLLILSIRLNELVFRLLSLLHFYRVVHYRPLELFGHGILGMNQSHNILRTTLGHLVANTLPSISRFKMLCVRHVIMIYEERLHAPIHGNVHLKVLLPEGKIFWQSTHIWEPTASSSQPPEHQPQPCGYLSWYSSHYF